MSKVRVYEVARELGMKNRELVVLFQSLGFSEVRNHMSSIEAEAVERVRRKLERRAEPAVVEERLSPTVVKRRSRAESPPSVPRAAVAQSEAAQSAPAATEPSQMLRRRPRAARAEAPPAARASAPASAPGLAGHPHPGLAGHPHPGLAGHPHLGSAQATSVPTPSAPSSSRASTSVPTPLPSAQVARSTDDGAPTPSTEAVTPAPFDGSGPKGPEHAPSAPRVAVPGLAAEAEHIDLEPAVFSAPPSPETIEAPPVRIAQQHEAPMGSDSELVPDEMPRRRPTAPPKSGIEVWEGRPGVPMPQRPRAAPPSARRTTYDPRAAMQQGRPGFPYGNRPIPGRSMRPGFRRGPGGFQPRHQRKGAAEVSTKEMADHKKVIKIDGETSLHALASNMSLKATDVLMKLLGMGMTGVNINTTLELDTAKLLASEFGWSVEDVAVNVDRQLEAATQMDADTELGDAVQRPPIVTVMGHVDHGKTTLLDTIRRTQVAAGEAGGITQHIGAYRVETKKGTICFLDTPGHEAFTSMRARGAQVTDLVILVVAADDGVMPQTREARSHAKDAEVPIIVAVNKMDMPGADPERIMRELANDGLQPEEWGGDTIYCRVSAKTGEGVDQLLDMLLLQSEMLELRARPKARASGVVIEALLDKGRGPVARVLVQDGTLERGDVIIAGHAYGKIRAMTDEKGRFLKEAGPATPVEVLGLTEVPEAGDLVHAVKDLKAAEALADERRKKAGKGLGQPDARIRGLGDLKELLTAGDQLELKVIVKGDVQGSVEAVSQALQKLSTQKVKLTVVHTGVGGITETDVNLAVAAGAVIIGFNIRPAGKSRKLAEQEGVEIRLYSIIYEAIDEVRAAMEGLLPARKIEKELGKAEVRQTFRISKVGSIAGCMVVAGVIKRSAEVRLVRDSVVVWSGKLSSLKRFKDDAREVREGLECGIGLEGFNDLKEGDIVEAFEIEEIKATLE